VIDIQVDAAEVLAAFDAGARRVIDETRFVVDEEARVAVAEIRAAWPRKTGTSADGWEVVSDGSTTQIDNRVGYASDVTIAGSGELAADQVVDPILAGTDTRLTEILPTVVERNL